MNQEFEIVKDENLYECEIEVRSKIKDYNNRGYRCISQSITSTITNNNIEFWVISLIFEYE